MSLVLTIFIVIVVAGGGFAIAWAWPKYIKKPKTVVTSTLVPIAEKPKTKFTTLITTIEQILDKKLKEEVPKEKISTDGKINALVVDVKKKLFRPMHVELFPDKDYGRQWEYLQYNDLYYLVRHADGTVEPINPPQILADSPSELYEAIQTSEDMQEVFGFQEAGSNKDKLFLIVIISGVALFIMFMAMSYQGGK
jgi:hypothetical protein